MKKIHALLCLTLLLALFSPSQSYAQIFKKKPKKSATTTSADAHMDSLKAIRQAYLDSVKQVKKDSLFISLERTPCFGHCPTYKIEIYIKGYVVYHGYNYVDHVGDFYTVVPRSELKKLFDYAKEIKFYNFNDSYINPSITDFPTTVTTMNVRGEKKVVVDGHNETPSELIFFEKMIDDTFKDTQWKMLKDNKSVSPQK